MKLTSIVSSSGVCRGLLARALPSERFWRAYVRHIPILRDSEQLQIIRGKMTDRFSLKPDDRAVDLGCGTGTWISEIAPKVASVTGLDIEMGMLRQAASSVQNNVQLVCGRIEAMPFKSDYFDVVGSILAVGYVDDQDAAISEIVRITRPGGRIIIVTPIVDADFSKVLKAEAASRGFSEIIGDRQNILKLLKGAAAAYVFGTLAELKAASGQWHFYTEKELAGRFMTLGLDVLYAERVYADQAILMDVRKPFLTLT